MQKRGLNGETAVNGKAEIRVEMMMQTCDCAGYLDY
jgi:hypothetical protein